MQAESTLSADVSPADELATRAGLQQAGFDEDEIELELLLYRQIDLLEANMNMVRQAIRIFVTDSRVKSRDDGAEVRRRSIGAVSETTRTLH